MSYEAETIPKHARMIADDLERRMEHWADVATQEKWDGRELIVGPLFMLVRQAMTLGMSKAKLIAMIESTDRFDSGGKQTQQNSMLISPNGRPLGQI